jgi:hypothetical protein
MTNRQRVHDAFKESATCRLREEVDYFMDTYSDDGDYSVADAVHDALNHAEANSDKPMIRDAINVLIAAGFYRPRTGEVVIMGRDKSPVRNGVRHDCEDAWILWIER